MFKDTNLKQLSTVREALKDAITDAECVDSGKPLKDSVLTLSDIDL